MKKKLMIISMASLLALGGIATVAGTIGAGGSLSLTRAATCEHSDGTERAFYAPGTYTHQNEKGETVTDETGTIPYWRCNTCCASDPSSARFDLSDHTKALSLDEVTIPKLTKVESSAVADGDKISTPYLKKFRYVDQGGGDNPADSKDADGASPWYVKETVDGKERTAIYFSRSGKTGDPDGNATEFRFLDDAETNVSSVSFWYRYKNWGTGTGSDGVTFTNLCQFVVTKDGKDAYNGVPNKLQNDDAWHYITIKYSDFDSAAASNSTFHGFLFKFADLRGYIMISGLSYETAVDVTLENASADGSSKTETVSVGSLPTTPTMDGKKFLGWYDESGNKVDSVTSSTSKLIARWGIVDAESAGVTGSTTTVTLKKFDSKSDFTGTGITNKLDASEGVELQLQDSTVQNCSVTMPAFNYNQAGRVDFFFDCNYGDDSSWAKYIYIKVGDYKFCFGDVLARKVDAYIVSDGTQATFYVAETLLGTLSTGVSSGSEGLTFTYTRAGTNMSDSLVIGNFKQHTVDYMASLKNKESALSSSSTEAEQIAAYQEYAAAYGSAYSSMSAYEKSSVTAPEATDLSATLKGKEVELVSVPKTAQDRNWTYANSLGYYSDAIYYTPKTNANGFLYANLEDGGKTKADHYYFDMPKINFAAYSKVVFKLSSSKNPKITVDGKDWVSSLSATSSGSPCVVTISTSGGKTTFTDGTNSVELSDEVAKGNKALRLVRYDNGNVNYTMFMCFSGFTATI